MVQPEKFRREFTMHLIPGVGMHGMAAMRPQDWRTHTRMENPMAAALVSGSFDPVRVALSR